MLPSKALLNPQGRGGLRACSGPQGLKAQAVFLVRLINSPITRLGSLDVADKESQQASQGCTAGCGVPVPPLANSNAIDRANLEIRKYLKWSIFRVQGFCSLLDANLLRSTIIHQSRNGISGSLVEIGVWHGKSFFILTKGRADGEKCLAMDMFATRPLVKGERQQIDEFRDNCAAHKIQLQPDEILQADSIDLRSEDVLKRVGPVRLFHVDGAHDYAHAKSDIALAANVINDRGVIVIDDAFNPNWPEVCAAMLDWLRENKEFSPWASTGQKVFVSLARNKEFYEQDMRTNFHSEIGRYVELFNHRFISLNRSRAAIIREKLLAKFIAPSRRDEYPIRYRA